MGVTLVMKCVMNDCQRSGRVVQVVKLLEGDWPIEIWFRAERLSE